MATRARSAYEHGRGRPPRRSAIHRSTQAPPRASRPKAPPRATTPQQVVQPRATPAAANINYGQNALSGGTGTYDVGSDPAVAAAHGLAAKIRATAQATAAAKRAQAAIEYGDASGVEGLTPEQQKAANENPYGIVQGIEHSYDVGRKDLEEQLNQANLFYSGYRGQQLGEAERAHGQARYDAATGFKGLMTDINDQLANALLQADEYEANAIAGSDGGSYGGGDGGYGSSAGLYGSGVLGALRGNDPRQAGPYNTGRPTYTPPKPVRGYPSRSRRTGNPLQRRGL